MLSISGGSGVVFADAAVRGGLTLPPFAPQTLAQLREMIPAFGSPQNPADITAAVFNDKTLFARTLDVVLEDPGLDQLVVLLASISGPSAAHSCEVIAAAAARTDKPVSVAMVGPAGQIRRGRQGAGGRQRAVRDHAGAAGPRGRDPGALCRRPPAPAAAQGARAAEAGRRPAGGRRHAERGREQGGAAGVRRARRRGGVRAGRPARWARPPASLEGPFAVKVVSRDVPHKTEAGGVKLGVAREALSEAARSVSDNARKAVPGAKIDGVLVSEMAQGLETLIGVINDPELRAGGGARARRRPHRGVEGRVYRVAPFDLETAREMIGELRGAKLFEGYRGKPAADKEALAQALVAVSGMAMALAPRIAGARHQPGVRAPCRPGRRRRRRTRRAEVGLAGHASFSPDVFRVKQRRRAPSAKVRARATPRRVQRRKVMSKSLIIVGAAVVAAATTMLAPAA